MAKSKDELKKLTKLQLEAYGRTVGIELDRRLTKSKLITQLEEHMKTPGVVQTVKEAVKAVVTGKVLLRDKNTGVFYKGAKPRGSKTGTSGGVPYWEV